MTKIQAKKIFKVAVFLYIISFLIINWSDVSWIFNYKYIYGWSNDFFNPYPSIDASSINGYFYPNHRQEVNQLVENIEASYTNKQNTIEISKLSVSAPIIFSASANKDILSKDLESGVVYYPGSVYPGYKGQIVILGHSAPVGWPKIQYEWVFSELDKLEPGDKIILNIDNNQYTYIVSSKDIIKRGEDVPVNISTLNDNVLTLISCWPPGKDYQRIAVQAELLTK